MLRVGEPRRMAGILLMEHAYLHRGAFRCGPPYCVCIFGNDGYGVDSRTVQEVEIVRSTLARHGIREIAFDTDGGDEAYTWVLLVEPIPDEAKAKLQTSRRYRESLVTFCDDLVWNAWQTVSGCEDDFVSYQRWKHSPLSLNNWRLRQQKEADGAVNNLTGERQ